jgi:hypothetical protein
MVTARTRREIRDDLREDLEGWWRMNSLRYFASLY